MEHGMVMGSRATGAIRVRRVIGRVVQTPRNVRLLLLHILFMASLLGAHQAVIAETINAIPHPAGTVTVPAIKKYGVAGISPNPYAFASAAEACNYARSSRNDGYCGDELVDPEPLRTGELAIRCNYVSGTGSCNLLTTRYIGYLCPEGPYALYGYVTQNDHTMCTNNQMFYTCPPVNPGEAPYTLDPGGLICSRPDQCQPPDVVDPATGQCVHCPIDPIPELPKDDACTNSLEAGKGKDVNNACTSKMTDEMKKQAQCLADKIQKLALPVPYTEPSATIRTETYQNHLLAVWKKVLEIKDKDLSNTEKKACAATIADANNEMSHHGITSEPSSKGNQAPHVLGRAVDIPEDVVKAMKTKVAMIKAKAMTPFFPFCLPCINNSLFSFDVQDYVNSASVNPPNCNLDWGGQFKRIDEVHFQLP